MSKLTLNDEHWVDRRFQMSKLVSNDTGTINRAISNTIYKITDRTDNTNANMIAIVYKGIISVIF